MVETLLLPTSVYRELAVLAAAEGTTPEEWVAQKVAQNRRSQFPPLTPEERAADSALLRQFVVSLGHPTGSDNDAIDADLAREYGDNHEVAAKDSP